jgi:cytochrome c peroxidase
VKRVVGRSLMALALATIAGCPTEPDAWDWGVPDGVPRPRVPADNPMSEAKVELGRRLFYDTRLSGNETQACAGCHAPSLAFTDGLAFSTGSTGDSTPRGSMAIVNVAYNSTLTWANPALTALEDQALVPMFGERPVELGLAGMEDVLLARLAADARYPAMFAEAFPEDAEPIRLANVVRSIACFERTLLSFDSPFDRWFYGHDESAVGDDVRRGYALFNDSRFECFHCHGGFNFAGGTTEEGTVIPEPQFHNTGLYDVDGRGAYPEPNRGLFETTGDARDMGRFRPPTLRNIAVTAPYMHDGSIATLEEVLDFYAAGGRNVTEGPFVGDGRLSPLKNVFIHGFTPTPQERADLLALLRSLTDDTFLTNPDFGPPE